MEFAVKELNSAYDFKIKGASYIGAPKSNTAMFIAKKISQMLSGLEVVSECLIFAETGTEVPEKLSEKHCFLFSDSPQLAYTNFLTKFEKELEREEQKKSYRLTDGGYYLGEDVTIGEDCIIEPMCLIGHGVTIGDRARIRTGAVIKNVSIGNDFLCGEKAVIGGNGFTITKDENGDTLRMPTIGAIEIGDHVEIGANSQISRGMAGNTILEDHVKTDAFVQINHDCKIGKNTEITAGVTMGGFTEIGEDVFIGMQAVLRNRIKIGDGAKINMGAVVSRSVEAGETVTGNLAIPHALYMQQLKKTLGEEV